MHLNLFKKKKLMAFYIKSVVPVVCNSADKILCMGTHVFQVPFVQQVI